MICISVIIPIYNMGVYLEACLQSVMDQTLKDIEVICVNDGSTDHSLAILQTYSSMYPNLIVLDQENCGVGVSRNRGLSKAQGEFVAFMDADDVYPTSDVLACLYRGAKEHNALICGGSLSRYVDHEQMTSFSPRDHDYTFYSDQMVSFRDYQFSYGFQRFIYQLAFLQEHQIFFPGYAYFEDPPFLAKALLKAENFYAINKVTYGYRMRHKRTPLSLPKTMDYATGLLDLLALSSRMKLSKLHAKMIEALHDDLAPAIYRYSAKNEGSLHELVTQINRTMDESLLRTEHLDLSTISLLEGEAMTRYVEQALASEKKLIEQIANLEKVIIYGAGTVGAAMADYLQILDGVEVIGFAVTGGTDNPSRVNGLEVKVINELIRYKDSALILVATYPYLHQEIQYTLTQLGFQHVQPIHYAELQLYGVLT